jgi:hypothetical protein
MKTVEVVYVEVKCIYEKLKEEGQKYSVGRIIRPPSGRIIRPLRSKVFRSFAPTGSWAGWIFHPPPFTGPNHLTSRRRRLARHLMAWGSEQFSIRPGSSQYPGEGDLPPLDQFNRRPDHPGLINPDNPPSGTPTAPRLARAIKGGARRT